MTKLQTPRRLPVPSFLHELRSSPEATVAAFGIVATVITAFIGAYVAIVISQSAIDAQKVMYEQQQRESIADDFDSKQLVFDDTLMTVRNLLPQHPMDTSADLATALDKLRSATDALTSKQWRLYEHMSHELGITFYKALQNVADIESVVRIAVQDLDPAGYQHDLQELDLQMLRRQQIKDDLMRALAGMGDPKE